MWRPQGAQLPRSEISHFRLDPALGHRQCLVCETQTCGRLFLGEGRFALRSHSPRASFVAEDAMPGRHAVQPQWQPLTREIPGVQRVSSGFLLAFAPAASR